MPVHEFRPVIGIEATQGEGKRTFDLFDRLEGTSFSFTPQCSCFRPCRRDVGGIERIDELTFHGATTVRDGIGFQKSGDLFVPLVGPDGNVFLDQ